MLDSLSNPEFRISYRMPFRLVKLHQKISGCFRSAVTVHGHSRLMSNIMTCRQHGTNDHDAVEMYVKDATPLLIRECLDMLA